MKLIEDRTIIDTRGTLYCENVALWHDGTLKRWKGCNAQCRWRYDGQVYVHYHKARGI